MTTEPKRRYRWPEEDSARWEGFDFREGDIVISTRSKSGTTWMQMICALLIFRTPRLPKPLGDLSPWLDHCIAPIDDVMATLERQSHRRFIKTHTPLDGVPMDDRATYIVVGRHPLDAAVSLYHQVDNLDRERLAELTGQPAPPDGARPDLVAWLHGWVTSDAAPDEELETLRGFMWHMADAWERRHQPNVVLVHYADLTADLPAEMSRIAGRLSIDIDEAEIANLAPAAAFGAMRANSEYLAPDTTGVFKSRDAFFRSGRSGEGRRALPATELAAYERRAAHLAPRDLLDWLHR